jgi:hypothetical protein
MIPKGEKNPVKAKKDVKESYLGQKIRSRYCEKEAEHVSVLDRLRGV